jgi:ABC-type multidrug transport system fused ATPase/permease subunit
MPLQYFFGWRIILHKKKNVANTQERGAYFQELLPAMKLVKYYAWEQFFLKQITEVRVGGVAFLGAEWARRAVACGRACMPGSTAPFASSLSPSTRPRPLPPPLSPTQIRARELAIQRKVDWIKTIQLAMVFATPPVTALVIFAAYELKEARLTSTLTFPILSLFNILRFPLVVLPRAMRAASDMLHALERIEEFLLTVTPERQGLSKQAGVQIVSSPGQCSWGGVGVPWGRRRRSGWSLWSRVPGCARGLPSCQPTPPPPPPPPRPSPLPPQSNAQFVHPGDTTGFTLNVKEFSVRPGELVAIAGRVGAGKSSLVSAILGNMERKSGTCLSGGRVAYVPQNPWCQNLSIRESIMFGSGFDQVGHALPPPALPMLR